MKLQWPMKILQFSFCQSDCKLFLSANLHLFPGLKQIKLSAEQLKGLSNHIQIERLNHKNAIELADFFSFSTLRQNLISFTQFSKKFISRGLINERLNYLRHFWQRTNLIKMVGETLEIYFLANYFISNVRQERRVYYLGIFYQNYSP